MGRKLMEMCPKGRDEEMRGSVENDEKSSHKPSSLENSDIPA